MLLKTPFKTRLAGAEVGRLGSTDKLAKSVQLLKTKHTAVKRMVKDLYSFIVSVLKSNEKKR
jgi:hypothetical protein